MLGAAGLLIVTRKSVGVAGRALHICVLATISLQGIDLYSTDTVGASLWLSYILSLLPFPRFGIDDVAVVVVTLWSLSALRGGG